MVVDRTSNSFKFKINFCRFISYKVGSFTQLYWLIWREVISKKRDPLATKVQIINTLMFAIVFGLIYLRLDVSSDNIQNINGVIFLCITNVTFANLFPVLQVYWPRLRDPKCFFPFLNSFYFHLSDKRHLPPKCRYS